MSALRIATPGPSGSGDGREVAADREGMSVASGCLAGGPVRLLAGGDPLGPHPEEAAAPERRLDR